MLLNIGHITYGLFWIFQGLNGFYHWKKIPFVSHKMDQTITHFYAIPGFMESVKILQIFIGLSLMSIKFAYLGLFLLAPILYGITLLHINFNKKPLPLLLALNLPFILFAIFP